MRAVDRLGLVIAACAAVAACGGGGGSVASTPPPPPMPAKLITELATNETFTGDATTNTETITNPGGIVQTTAASRAPITVRYDAAAQSYTVTGGGPAQTYAPADRQPDRGPGEVSYRKATNGGSDILFLVTTPYSGSVPNRYVGLAYRQTTAVSAGRQDTVFTTFTYGFDTPAAAVPRSGSARWTTDIFGLLTEPGLELRAVQGSGDFNVDFRAGRFTSLAYVDEIAVVTGGTTGGVPLSANGRLTSGNGFTGDLSYRGVSSADGTLTGKFYGPAADEIGATFAATGPNGTVLTGALTGQRAGQAGRAVGVVAAPAGVVSTHTGFAGWSPPPAVGDRPVAGRVDPASPSAPSMLAEADAAPDRDRVGLMGGIGAASPPRMAADRGLDVPAGAHQPE